VAFEAILPQEKAYLDGATLFDFVLKKEFSVTMTFL